MRLLIDACLARRTVDELAAAGHDVEWVRTWPGNPADEEVLAAAAAGERVLITLDKDFGELAVGLGHSHAGIVRLVNLAVHSHAAAVQVVLDHYEKDLANRAIVTAAPGRIRIRSAE